MACFNSHRARELICFVDLLGSYDLSLSSGMVDLETAFELEYQMDLPESCVCMCRGCIWSEL